MHASYHWRTLIFLIYRVNAQQASERVVSICFHPRLSARLGLSTSLHYRLKERFMKAISKDSEMSLVSGLNTLSHRYATWASELTSRGECFLLRFVNKLCCKLALTVDVTEIQWMPSMAPAHDVKIQACTWAPAWGETVSLIFQHLNLLLCSPVRQRNLWGPLLRCKNHDSWICE